MKLNLGCGTNHKDGYINVDIHQPADQIHDLEQYPWPWARDAVDEIVLHHVLEHLGADIESYKTIWQEIYRVVRHSGKVVVTVPHPHHDHFIIDPTHVRPVMMEFFPMLSKKINQEWIDTKKASTPLAIHWGVNFELEKCEVNLDPLAKERIRLEIIDLFGAEIESLMTPRAQILAQRENNIVQEYTVTLRVIK